MHLFVTCTLDCFLQGVILHKREFGTSYGVSFLLAEQSYAKVRTDIHWLMKHEELVLG
jgi:hypothetical protein